MSLSKSKLDVYPLESCLVAPGNLVEGNQYTITSGNRGHKVGPHGKVEVKLMKTPREKLLSLRKRCMEEQRVESVEGVLLVHLHRHPHVLLLKQRLSRKPEEGRIIPSAASNSPGFAYRLPGGRCQKGEKPEDCLMRKLGRHLLNEEKMSPSAGAHTTPDTVVDVSSGANLSPFRVGEVLGQWYRPHLSPLIYPYVPPHISPDAVKEVRTVFLVHMERNMEFQIPHADVELVAVPLFDLYDNTAKYSPDIVSLPVALSRVYINCCSNVEI
eukprot:gene9170-6449_t